MAHVVVLGAGLGGTIMAYELREKLGEEHRLSVVTNGGSLLLCAVEPVGRGRLARPGGGRGRPCVRACRQRDIALHPAGSEACSSRTSAGSS